MKYCLVKEIKINRKEIARKIMEKHLEKSLKILNILSILTILVGVAELIAGIGKGIITPSAHVFCTWCVAGSGVLNVLVGVCGIRLSKGRAVICKPDMLIVHEGMFERPD